MNSTQQYRDALSQGMTPCEAEQWIAEEEEYERIEWEASLRLAVSTDGYTCGLELHGQEPIDSFFRFTCACGSYVAFPLNKIPEVDTPMPCGNPKHWAVRFLP